MFFRSLGRRQAIEVVAQRLAGQINGADTESATNHLGRDEVLPALVGFGLAGVADRRQIQARRDFCYDDSGNVRGEGACPAPGVAPRYEYDAEGRLFKLNGSVIYVYDGDGKRASKPNRMDWTGVGPDALSETDTGGTVQANYIFFGGKRIARIDNPGQNESVHYYVSDQLGSVAVVASEAGVMESETLYFPYGAERWSSGADPDHYKFTGKEHDAETELEYFGARHYGATVARFMSPDVPFMDQHSNDPQSWNLYSYARNNPLFYTDPTGNCVMNEDAGQDTPVACPDVASGPAAARTLSANGG